MLTRSLFSILVWIKAGICTADSIINIALCLLGFIPGLIHAWYIILKYPDQDDDAAYEPIPGGSNQRRDLENGQVTYYYVSHPPPQQRSYGATDPRVQPSENTQPKHPNQTSNAAAGSSSGQQSEARPPPTYAEAVQGDHKIQTQD